MLREGLGVSDSPSCVRLREREGEIGYGGRRAGMREGAEDSWRQGLCADSARRAGVERGLLPSVLAFAVTMRV